MPGLQTLKLTGEAFLETVCTGHSSLQGSTLSANIRQLISTPYALSHQSLNSHYNLRKSAVFHHVIDRNIMKNLPEAFLKSKLALFKVSSSINLIHLLKEIE